MHKTKQLLSALCIYALLAPQVYAESLQRFYGRYAGEALAGDDKMTERRDLSVTIGPRERGFFVHWTTAVERSGRVKKKEYTIDFVPTERDGVFGSAMRTNMFGQQVPLDPMAGDPYVWARLVADTLTVYALHITTDGGYEMQVYARTLTAAGLDLEFTRFRDGVALRTVNGLLTRLP